MQSSFPRKDETSWVYKKSSGRERRSAVFSVCRGRTSTLGVRTLVCICLVLMLLLCLAGFRGVRDSGSHAPVVLVAVLDDISSPYQDSEIFGRVLQNRWEYANVHGSPPTRLGIS